MSQIIRKHMKFHGEVQGVGFRYSAYHLAESRRITGWVRNDWDGCVTMEVQGYPDMIDDLVRALSESRWVMITGIEQKKIPIEPHESSFRIEYDY